MAEKKAEPFKYTIIDDPHAPDFFASWNHGLALRHGVIHATFVSDRPDHSSSGPASNMVVIGRLIMPVPGARDLATKLLAFLDQIEKAPPTPDVQGPPPTLQ